MTPLHKGLLVGVLHVIIVGGIGVQLLIDRATKPRVWVRTAPFDPDRPIRGRYVRLRLEATPGPGFDAPITYDRPVNLVVRNNQLVAEPAVSSSVSARIAARDGERISLIAEPVAYFIPEHVRDPSIRGAGEELWVEVTVPAHGPPRPIRLGVRRAGTLTPLP
jgi:hypothetical protein